MHAHQLILSASAFLFAVSCTEPKHAAKAAAPAAVSGHAVETSLSQIVLTAQAETRLGIETAKIERKSLALTRTLGADVIAPASGASAIVRYAATASMDPSALAAAQIEADGEVSKAKVAVTAATSNYERAERLLAAGAESQRVHDDALEVLRTAQASLGMAQSKRALLGQSVGATQSANRIWVRASLYAGDYDRIDHKAPVQIAALGRRTSRRGLPVSAPATSNALTSTTFLFYEVDNADGAFRMGERVEAIVPMNAHEEGLAVPSSAVLYDVNGGEWVYALTGEHTYARQRIEIRSTVGDIAVITRGPPEGTSVVVVGAPELFGTEFGVSH